jgi:hypothetical protein
VDLNPPLKNSKIKIQPLIPYPTTHPQKTRGQNVDDVAPQISSFLLLLPRHYVIIIIIIIVVVVIQKGLFIRANPV